MDQFGNLLSAMRLSGGVILDVELRGEWSIASEFPPDVCAEYFPVRGSLVSYHYVREGSFWADAGNGSHIGISAGCILFFPRNHRHRLFNAEVPTVLASDYALPAPEGPPVIRFGDGGEAVKLYCGFMSAGSPDTPLLDRLPSMMVIRPDDVRREWMDASMRVASEEMSPTLVAKIAEIMFAETLRHFFKADVQGQRLVQGLSDPCLARALDFIHQHYAEDIDVDRIARAAGMSKTVLGERFSAMLGEPPIRYCSRLRLRRAADLLEQGESCAEAAHASGFSSEASFTRAFKREYGKPPAAWRRSFATETG